MTPATWKILLVEDSEADVVLGLRVLSQFPVTVRTAKDAAAAETALFDESNLLDLVLLDLSLPGVHGLDVLRKIKDDPRTRHLKVVIVTGNQAEKTVLECYRLRCDGVVTKPLTKESLAAILEKFGF